MAPHGPNALGPTIPSEGPRRVHDARVNALGFSALKPLISPQRDVQGPGHLFLGEVQARPDPGQFIGRRVGCLCHTPGNISRK